MIRSKEVVKIADKLSLFVRGATEMRGAPKRKLSINGEPVPIEKIMQEFGVDRSDAEEIQRRLCS